MSNGRSVADPTAESYGDGKNDPLPSDSGVAEFGYSVAASVAPDAGVSGSEDAGLPERNDPVSPDAGVSEICEDGDANKGVVMVFGVA